MDADESQIDETTTEGGDAEESKQSWPQESSFIHNGAYLVAFVLFVCSLRYWNREPQAWGQVCLLLALLSIELPVLLRSLTTYWGLRGRAHLEIPRVRHTYETAFSSLYSYAPRILVLWFTFGTVWDWQSVGFKEEVGLLPAVILGLVAGLVYSLCLYRDSTNSSEITPHLYATYRLLLPRGRAANWLMSTQTVLISPFFEELVFRGFFVVFLLELLPEDSAPWGIVTGLFLCLLLHLYQGIRYLFMHFLSFVIYMLLLVSPIGLLGVIGFHVGCNLFFQLSFYRWWRFQLKDGRLQKMLRTQKRQVASGLANAAAIANSDAL